MDCNNNQFILRQVTFSFLSWHFLGTFSSLLHFTKYLPFIRHPNSCIVVYQQVICLLVLLLLLLVLAFHCHLLDGLASRRVVSLLTRIQSGVHYSLGITFSVFVDNGGQKRGQTSRPFVRAKIQTNCNFKAYILHGSNLLGVDCRGWFMLHFRLPKRYVV